MPITAQQAMTQAMALYPAGKLNPKQLQNAAWLGAAYGFIQNGALPVTPPYGPDCTGQTAAPLNLVTGIAGPALATGGVGLQIAGSILKTSTAIPIIGSVIAGVQMLVGFITAIFQHHAQAVRRDLAFACGALPAANNAFVVIFTAVMNGTTTPQNASLALDQIYNQFMAAGGAQSPSSIPSSGSAINDSPWCNGNCELSIILKAMVLYWQSQLASIPANMQLPSSPAGYSPLPYTAVVPSPVAGVVAGSPTLNGNPVLAASVVPSAGYGPLLAIAAVIAAVFILPRLMK